MSAPNVGVSNWPCGPDCCHAAPLAGYEQLWCLREVPLPVKRTVSVGQECAWFCVKPPVSEEMATPGRL